MMTTSNGEYIGVYDLKESNLLRPTLEKRVHINYPVSKCITTRKDSCTVIVGERNERESNQLHNIRIRKLTEKECLALMGFTEEDYNNIVKMGISAKEIYRIAGDSIVTTVLMSVFAPIVNEEDDTHEKIVNDYVETLKVEDHL